MSNREFEKWLEGLLSQDLSRGSEQFREALLERCIEALDAADVAIELNDDDLELLSAAGDASTSNGNSGQANLDGAF